MTDHPITPPPALVEQWLEQSLTSRELAAKAFQAGADQELEACCEILRGEFNYHHLAEPLRAARRPKPPSLKEQALAALKRQAVRSVPSLIATEDCDTIRLALEQLPND